MKIPNYIHAPFVDKEGHVADQWEQMLTQLLDGMQENLSNNGFVPPNQPTSIIDQIAAADLQAFTESGAQKTRLLMDTDTNELKAIQNGTIKTVTLT